LSTTRAPIDFGEASERPYQVGLLGPDEPDDAVFDDLGRGAEVRW